MWCSSAFSSEIFSLSFFSLFAFLFCGYFPFFVFRLSHFNHWFKCRFYCINQIKRRGNRISIKMHEFQSHDRRTIERKCHRNDLWRKRNAISNLNDIYVCVDPCGGKTVNWQSQYWVKSVHFTDLTSIWARDDNDYEKNSSINQRTDIVARAINFLFLFLVILYISWLTYRRCLHTLT